MNRSSDGRKKRTQDRKGSSNNNNNNNNKKDRKGSTSNNNNNNNKKNNENSNNNNKNKLSASAPVFSPRLQVGYSGTFLLQFQSSLLENDNIVGTMPTQQNNPEVYNNLMVVTEFLRQHALAVAAESSTGSVSAQRSNSTDISTTMPVIAATFYMPTVKDFAIRQLDRQAAGLRTNTTKEAATGLATLVNGHTAALKAAIEHSSGGIYDDGSEIGNGFGLSKNLLCSLHSLLCPSHAQAGKFRINQAKAGNALFCPAVKIDTEMESLFALMESLWSSWLNKKSNQNSCSTTLLKETYHAVSLAAILMYSINDIHPFADGNGRIARICANYALQRTTGLPFTLTLVATQVHRQEYIEGLKKGHLTLQGLSKDKNSTQSSSSSSTQTVSTFEPIIRMLLDRMAHAIHQLQQLLDERARAATADEESRIARVVRERAASGQCMICLDEKPNIATLCCGQAVHLNCIAEWLANQTTCINCRGPLPQLVRPKAPAEAAARDEHELTTTTTGSTDEYDATTTTSHSSASSTSTSTSSDSTGDTTTTMTNEQNNQPCCPYCTNRAASDCINSMCGRCCVLNGLYGCNRHNR